MAAQRAEPQCAPALEQAGQSKEGIPQRVCSTGQGAGCRAQSAERIQADKLHLSLTFYPPTRRAFDLDNALARMKSGLDGLADVLEVDDRHWSLSIDRAEEVGGMVKVEVRHV